MFIRPAAIVLFLLALAGCGSETERQAPGGEAFVGPMTLSLRAELNPRAPTAATVKHGDRVIILQRRRRFAKVRAPNGAEGWVDSRQLMRPDQVDELRSLWKYAASLPSMGAASVWDKLNIHTQPSRLSPSFDQIPEQGRVDVLWQVVVPKSAYTDRGIDPPEQPRKASKQKERPKKEAKQPKVEPPPAPPAPKPPDNWLDLSRTAPPEELAAEPQADPEPEPPPVQLEDWTLVRTKEGKAGWVVTRSLTLAIPDEVAQYAEGQRITSYFSLGDVPDGGQIRHHWLWTTISGKLKDYQFDSFRVFIWNTRRHRYETAYIERNVTGYFPVEVKPVEFAEGKQTIHAPGFTLLLAAKDGSLARKTYAFQGYRVRLLAKEPGQRTDPLAGLQANQAPTGTAAPPPPPEAGFVRRLRDRIDSWQRRLFPK